ncbi:hypothetical protein GCM10010411_76460 [Actinomadura fulvescens]|uniref:Uncharacterized protein n=1 Tax=Actinomadura fulvescens TaxID=46160 RepID=A0ABN3QKN9_9ACTN
MTWTTTEHGDIRCPCGNLPENAGFEPCDPTGTTVEIDPTWTGLYRCNACGCIDLYPQPARLTIYPPQAPTPNPSPDLAFALFDALWHEAAAWAADDAECAWAEGLRRLPPADALEALEDSDCLPSTLANPVAETIRFLAPAIFHPINPIARTAATASHNRPISPLGPTHRSRS